MRIILLIITLTATFLSYAGEISLPQGMAAPATEAADGVAYPDNVVIYPEEPEPEDEDISVEAIERQELRDGERNVLLKPGVYYPDELEGVHDWWTLLKKGKLNLKDTTVVYPRFMKFCVNVYNWADRTFNSYDEEYVEGTGRRWKAYIKNDNWSDNYAMNFRHKMPMRMMSDVYCNLGGYIQYMAVSVGYSLDMSNIIGNKPLNHKRMEFGFNCARFNVDAYYAENTGGTYMRTFGHYRDGHLFKQEFTGLRLVSYGVDAYYFFNNRRYSQGAAYNFSKYQRKSQGSFVLGLSYSNQDITLDFTQLPENLRPYLTVDLGRMKFHYNNLCLLLGYGYNWVFARNFLFNISGFPAIGVNHCREDSVEGEGYLFSTNFQARTAIVYNYKDLFAGLSGKMNGHWYISDNYSFWNSIVNFGVNVGVRF